jgi:hypothetical protein
LKRLPLPVGLDELVRGSCVDSGTSMYVPCGSLVITWPHRAPPESRTPNLLILNQTPLPVGLEGRDMQLFRVYDGTRTRNIPDHNRARCLRASYTVGIDGFEPPRLLLPKQAPYQTWLYPVSMGFLQYNPDCPCPSGAEVLRSHGPNAPCTGIEPVTLRSTGERSTTELTRLAVHNLPMNQGIAALPVLRTPTGTRTRYPRVKISDLNP